MGGTFVVRYMGGVGTNSLTGPTKKQLKSGYNDLTIGYDCFDYLIKVLRPIDLGFEFCL